MEEDWGRRVVSAVLAMGLLVGLSGFAFAMFDLEEHDRNRVLIPISNFGPFGQDIAGSAGTYWPQGTDMAYIFGAGLWLGAIRGSDTLVSVGYNPADANFEFYPGPPEHNPDHQAYPNSHPEDRVYMSTDPADTAEWPLRDSTGAKIILSEQDSYCNLNDGRQFEGDSIGLLLTQHGLMWDSTMVEDIVFFIHTVRNYGPDTASSVYTAVGADNDVGYADDDLVGLDRGLELGYTYTLNQEPGWPAPPPYYVGYVLLQGPKADDTVGVGPDTMNPDTVIYPGEHLVLTSFKRWDRIIEPDTDPERYLVLAGYDFSSGQYNPFDTVDTTPFDKRQLLSCGPFSLVPDEADTFAFAIVFANGNTGGLTRLRELAEFAQNWYDGLFIEPEELVTGGGWIPGGPSGPGTKRTFGFNAHCQGAAVWGQLQFIDHETKLKVHSDTVNSVVIHEGGTAASFSGDCRVREHGGQLVTYTFDCEVVDGGEPGRGVDRFSIAVYDGKGNLYYAAGDYLAGGNIQVDPETNDSRGSALSHSEIERGSDAKPLLEGEEATRLLSTPGNLLQNCPNPFFRFTTIRYSVQGSRGAEGQGRDSSAYQLINLSVYDVSGRLVRTLVDTEEKPGVYSVDWDGKADNGVDVARGVYFCRLAAGDAFTAVRKLVVLR